MNTPKTEFVAQQCSTDGEYSDVQAYNVMYAHARQLETQVQELQKVIAHANEIAEAMPADSELSKPWMGWMLVHFKSIHDACAILEKTK